MNNSHCKNNACSVSRPSLELEASEAYISEAQPSTRLDSAWPSETFLTSGYFFPWRHKVGDNTWGLPPMWNHASDMRTRVRTRRSGQDPRASSDYCQSWRNRALAQHPQRVCGNQMLEEREDTSALCPRLWRVVEGLKLHSSQTWPKIKSRCKWLLHFKSLNAFVRRQE